MSHKGYHDIDTSKFSFFSTDLAVEAHEHGRAQGEIPGIQQDIEEVDNIKIERVFISTAQAGQAINKAPGKYVTIYAPGLRTKDTPLRKNVLKVFAKEFSKYIEDLPEHASALVIGLGNANATPDAIGPRVIDNLLISRHFFEVMPDKVEKGFRSISAFAPGVMGQTGIETSDIVYGIIQQIKPDIVIVIDALASRSIERINTTIQIADSGINPGAGVGNQRKAISKETLGVPVIAVGVPTVVDAVTIVHDAMEYVAEYIKKNNGNIVPAVSPGFMTRNMAKKQAVYHSDQIANNLTQQHAIPSSYESLSESQKKQLIFQVLKSEGHQFMVTPKEIDIYIEDMANIIAGGLNAALHPKITAEEAAMYTH